MLSRVAGRDRFQACRAEAPLVLRPLADGIVYTGQLGGGFVRGDAVRLTLEVHRGATLTVRGQASNKVYEGASRSTTEARVDGTLILAAEPIVPYARSRWSGVTEIDLGQHGSVCLWDAYTAGRVAAAERWQQASFESAIVVRRAGALAAREAVRICGVTVPNAFATMVVVGPAFEGRLDALAARVRGRAYASFRRRGDVAVARVALAEPGLSNALRDEWLGLL